MATATFIVDSTYNLNVGFYVTGTANNINWGDGSPLESVTNDWIYHTYSISNIFTITFDSVIVRELLLTTNSNIISLDVSELTTLEYLRCNYNRLTNLNTSGLNSLGGIDCDNNQLISLIIGNSTFFTFLNCYNNQLTTLNVSNLNSLQYLYCYDNQLTNLNVSGCSSLQYLYCYNNQLTTLNTTNLILIEELNCSDNQLTSLILPPNNILKYLYCYNNQLTTLNTNFTNLVEIECSNNQLTSLNVINSPNITVIYCSNNKITSLTINPNSNSLYYIECSNNKLTSLNLSNTNIQYLNIDKNKLTNIGIQPILSNILNVGNYGGYLSLKHQQNFQTPTQSILDDVYTLVNSYSWQVLLTLYPTGTPGTLDLTFNEGEQGFNDVTSVVVTQPDGKILVGGNFYDEYNNQSANYIIRLNIDGSIDNTFNSGNGFNDAVKAIELQPDGKIIIGGLFTEYNNQSVGYIVRLNTDGSIDDTFNSIYSSSPVWNTLTPFLSTSSGSILFDGTPLCSVSANTDFSSWSLSSNDFTFEWFQYFTGDINNNPTIFDYNTGYLTAWFTPGTFNLFVNGNTYNYTLDSSIDGSWHHFAVTRYYDGMSYQWYIFQNGNQIGNFSLLRLFPMINGYA